MRRALPVRAAALLAALLLTTLGQARTVRAEETCPGEAQGFRRIDPDFKFAAYRWDPAELKVGQFFAVEVVECGTAPSERVTIDATMPAHGHGMNYRPTAEHIAPGRYRFTGLMLHMPGTWRFTFTFRSADVRIVFEHDVDLKR